MSATTDKGGWFILRDGKDLAGPFPTDMSALAALHNFCSSSWDHAIRHEGYSVVHRDTLGATIDTVKAYTAPKPTK